MQKVWGLEMTPVLLACPSVVSLGNCLCLSPQTVPSDSPYVGTADVVPTPQLSLCWWLCWGSVLSLPPASGRATCWSHACPSILQRSGRKQLQLGGTQLVSNHVTEGVSRVS